MPPFPVPHLERHELQILPEPGTLLTETELLHLLWDLLHPLEGLLYCYELAVEASTGEIFERALSFIDKVLEEAVLLLQAWHEHQPPPGARRRATPPADPLAPETAAVPDPPDAPTAPPPRRRPGRSDTDA